VVVKTIAVGKAPKGIAYGRFEARAKLFVANSGDNSLSVIDPVANVVEQTIPLRFGEQPEDVAVYAGEFRGGAVYVANYRSQSVSVVDPVLYRETERVQVGRGPVALAADPPLEQVTGGPGLDFADLNLWRSYRQTYFHVYVANQLSNTVTVIVCRTADGGPERTIELKAEFSPTGLAVDPSRAKVYVANRDSNNLSVIDIIQLVKGRQSAAVSAISNVGPSGMAVAPDPFFERLYLLRARPAEIDFIQTPSAALRGVTTPVLGAVRVAEGPRRMSLDPEGRKLYVTCQGADALVVVDKTSRKVEQTIKVGHSPYAVAIIP
jgi:YVTN family beta-propeller protein